MKRLKYMGTTPKGFRGIDAVKPGDVITPPEELIPGLLASGEFEWVDEPKDESKPKPMREAKEEG